MAINSIELFAGAGGLALGSSLAGISPLAVIEWNRWACNTIKANQRLNNPHVSHWPLYEGDVREYDFSNLGDVDIVTGGPPCQPFSLGGKHKGSDDNRNMFPATIEVVRKLRPKAFLLENVKGLATESFNNYLRYTLLQLSFPELTKKENEQWPGHMARLEKEKVAGTTSSLRYDVVFSVVNAADYGVPQRRERLFIVGFRHDLGIRWNFPSATHSIEGLLHAQWISGEYWEKHRICSKNRPAPEPKYKGQLEKLRGMCVDFIKEPWLTVRDALMGLPEPYDRNYSPPMGTRKFSNHEYQPGAKFYNGHTGSPLDLPAKTIKAGAHGVPGGENMMVDQSGKPRYFTVRESARLQCFPDDYVFYGSWTESMRQLGNAVPVKLGWIMSSAIVKKLAG